MKFIYPSKNAETDFQSLEFKGMQALAIGHQKEAAACYEKAILTDPSLKTIQRIVKQYKTAGYDGSHDCVRYWQLSYQCEKFDAGKDKYANFHFGLNRLRNKHSKFVKVLHQQAVIQAEAHSKLQGSSSRVSPPPYDESITEQTALLENRKPNQ